MRNHRNNRKLLVHMFENSVGIYTMFSRKFGNVRRDAFLPRKMVTDRTPSPFLRYTAVAAAFNGFMGARVEMACL